MLVFCSDSHILPSPTPGPSTCLPNYYRCSSGACVMDSWVCDGYRDCADGSDEEACPSPGECWPSRSRGTCLCGANLPGGCPGHSGARLSAPPAFWDPGLWGRGLLLTPRAGRPGALELQGRLSNCLLIFLHEKASRPAFHPGCGWVTFASFSTGNYDGNYRGSVWLCVKPSRGRA